MSWRIGEYVVRGQLDNRVKGRVTGTLWIAGRKDPVELSLRGNGGADTAGRLLTFSNRQARPETHESIATIQLGRVGEFTASKKVKIPTLPSEAELEMGRTSSFRWSNAMFLEWFSEENGRVLIEGLDFEAKISDPAWTLTEEELKASVENAATEPVAGEDEETSAAIERVLRINDLKHEAELLIGGEILHATPGPVPPELQEKFWQEVVDFEKAPNMSRLKMLELDGVRPKAATDLSEEELHTELWGVINGLAARRTFLDCTDHLSDRKLYNLLLNRVLDEPTTLLPVDSEWSCHLSMHEYGEPGDEDGVGLYLKYYADEEIRRQWAEDFPQDSIPESELPPYSRDHKLPAGPEREEGGDFGFDGDGGEEIY